MLDINNRRWSRRTVALTLMLTGVSGVWVAASLADRNERTLTLEVECIGQRCTARVGRVELSTTVAHNGTHAGRLGLYVYHPYEFDRRQYFRGLQIEPRSDPDHPLVLSLTDTGSVNGWQVDRGWQVKPGRGITHAGPQGATSVAILNRFESRDFRLRVQLDANVDSGVMLRASDSANGTVFVVRSRSNDAYFFELNDGRAGPITEIVALRTLHGGRELLRLSGLFAEIVLLAALALFVLRLLSTSVGPGLERSLPRWVEASVAPRWLLPVLALVSFISLAAIARFGLDAIPHLADETAYLFQAKIFAGGALWAPPPAPVDFFLHEHVVITADSWYGKYPPLFPLLLSVGVMSGAPWLVNPLLGAAIIVGIFFLARELADWRWATVAAVLAISSPFFLVMGGTMMSHVASALFVSWFLVFLVRGLNRASLGWGLAAGGCLGLAVWTRPYTAFLVALFSAGYLLACLWRGPARRAVWICGTAIVLATVPFAVGYLMWNGLHSDDAVLAIGLHDSYHQADTLGFGEDRGRGWLRTWGSWGHTPAKALRSVFAYLEYTSRQFLGWPFRLSLSLAFAAVLSSRRRPTDLLLWLLPAGLVSGHMLYWATQHLGYGARYWFAAFPGLIVLTTLGLKRGISRGEDRARLGGLSWGVAVAIGLLVAWNLTSYLPSRLQELGQYSGVTAELKREVERDDLRDAVVMVQTEGLNYNDGFFMNDPFLRDGNVFVRDLGYRNAELYGRFPDRPIYRWSDGVLELVRASGNRLTESR